MEEDPAGAEGQGLLQAKAGTEGAENAEQEGHREHKDAESDGAEADVDEQVAIKIGRAAGLFWPALAG